MTTAEEYRTASTTLYDQAMIELSTGDFRQGSEKLWGASAQALKSLAERRGWPHGSHAEFYRIMRRVVDETDERDLLNHFNSATQLHINFYENWLDEVQISQLAEDVSDFVERIARL